MELKGYQERTGIPKLKIGILGVGNGGIFYPEHLFARALDIQEQNRIKSEIEFKFQLAL